MVTKRYPSPAKDIVHVHLAGTAIVALVNNSGKTMLSKIITNKGEINVSSFTDGVYYIKNTVTGEMQNIVVLH